MTDPLDGHLIADYEARWKEEGPEIYRRITECAHRIVIFRILAMGLLRFFSYIVRGQQRSSTER
jgi:hypothetical protein